jgi:hypothetical protein
MSSVVITDFATISAMATSYQWLEGAFLVGAVAVLLVIAYFEYRQEVRGMTPDQKRRWEKEFRDDPQNW